MLIIILTIVAFILDKHVYSCNRGRLILALHHALNIFANFGWVLNNKSLLLVYLCAPIVCLLHWYTNDNKCILTQKYNSICNLPQDTPFNDLFNIIGLKKHSWWMNYGHHTYMIICLCIAFWKLLEN